LDVLVEQPVAGLQPHDAALWRIRVGIIEGGETGRIFQVAEGRKPVDRRFGWHLRKEGAGGKYRAQCAGPLQETPSRGPCHHLPAPQFALPGSIHQESMSTPMYDGCSSGMPNLFQYAKRMVG